MNQAGGAARIHAVSPTTRVLGYKSGTDLLDNCGASTDMCASGITYQEAVAHDEGNPADPWLLRDAAGKSLTAPAYPHSHLANVGSSSYQQQWLRNVTGALARYKLNGVYIDSVLGTITGWSGGAVPTKYPTDASWEAAMRSFMAAVGPALKRKNLYVLVSAYKAGTNDSSTVVPWWQTIAPYVNGLQSEYWEQNPTKLSQPFDTDPRVWTGHWVSWLALGDTANKSGVDFFAVQKGTRNSTQMMTYGKASYLLVWNGRGGGYVWSPTDGSDPWRLAYTRDIGKPQGARYVVGVGWRRNYSGGTVLVNPHYSSAQTFVLGRKYVMPSGQTVTSVLLRPHTGMILTKSG